MAMTRSWCVNTFIGLAVLGCLRPELLVACASQQRPPAKPVESQSYADAIRHICDADTLANIPADADELSRSRQREDYIVENTKNSDAIFFATVFRTKPPNEQSEMLAREAQGANLSKCELADALGGK